VHILVLILAVIGAWFLLAAIFAVAWSATMRRLAMPERSGRLEVQGIVSIATGEPLVQFRQIEDGEATAEWQAGVADAREVAQNIVEAAMNATYDAAIIAWAKETWPDDELMGARMLQLIRDYRADAWGLPDQPEDWRT
jgi:hypothetical protein